MALWQNRNGVWAMRKICFFGLLLVVVGAGFLRWRWHDERKHPEHETDGRAPHRKTRLDSVPLAIAGTDSSPPINGVPAPAPELTVQEKYDASLVNALDLVADRHYAEALAALETARSLQDTDLIRGQIDKLKARVEQDKA